MFTVWHTSHTNCSLSRGFTISSDENYVSDDIDQTDQDQHSLPDLVFNSPEPVKTDPLDPRVEDNQQEYGYVSCLQSNYFAGMCISV